MIISTHLILDPRVKQQKILTQEEVDRGQDEGNHRVSDGAGPIFWIKKETVLCQLILHTPHVNSVPPAHVFLSLWCDGWAKKKIR